MTSRCEPLAGSYPANHLRDILDYDPDTGAMTWKPRNDAKTNWNDRFAGKPAFACDNGRGYLTGSIFNVPHLGHRVVWAWMTGEWPSGQIDHINGVKSDNRWCNLRDVSEAENKLNQRKPRSNTTGHMGVFLHRPSGRWRACIGFQRKTVHLGYFDEFDDAVRARKAAEVRLGFHKNHGVSDAV